MVTAPTRPHIAAIKALLEAEPNPLAVYVSRAGKDAVPPWIVIEPSPGIPGSETLAEPTTELEVAFLVKCVGMTWEQAFLLSDRAAAKLNFATPVIEGRACWPIWCDTTQPIQEDRQTADTYYYAVSRWRLHSVPE